MLESSCKEEEAGTDKNVATVKEETGTSSSKEGVEEEAEVSDFPCALLYISIIWRSFHFFGKSFVKYFSNNELIKMK